MVAETENVELLCLTWFFAFWQAHIEKYIDSFGTFVKRDDGGRPPTGTTVSPYIYQPKCTLHSRQSHQKITSWLRRVARRGCNRSVQLFLWEQVSGLPLH